MLTTSHDRRDFLRQSGIAVGIGMINFAADYSNADEEQQATLLPRLSDLRLKAIDLREPIQHGIDHICVGAIDRRQGCLPWGQFRLLDIHPSARHIYWESPHMVGRFLDALVVSAPIITVAAAGDAVEGLRNLLFESLKHESGFAFNRRPDPSGRTVALMHNCREVLLALSGLIVWKQCEQSQLLASKLVRAMDKATRDTGAFPTGILATSGWQKDAEDQFPCISTGRSIGALVKYFRATHDYVALELAIRFADHNISRAFAPEGALTKEAGFHLHSIYGTVAGILDLGRLINHAHYVELCKQLYENGLKQWRTSFGWARERRDEQAGRDEPKGEANNTGDLIQIALLLGRSGYPQYFDDAERFIRNGLLASQIINTEWIAAADGTHDEDEILYSDIRKRSRGAFTFTTPNAFHSYNTDLMGGPIQSLCDAWHDITLENETGVHINLLFSRDCKAFTFRSYVPEEGRVEIVMSQAADVSVRLPRWIPRNSLKSRLNGNILTSHFRHDEIFFPDLRPNDQVEITFEQPRRKVSEKVAGYKTPFAVEWKGDTVTDITPRSHKTRLY